MQWLTENWQSIVGGGSITTIIVYLTNRKNSKADLLTKVEGIYDSLVEDLKDEREEYKAQIQSFKRENKEEREEYKEQIQAFKAELTAVRADYRNVQGQMNNVMISYGKEIEVSQNWEKLHRELSDKYNVIEKMYASVDAKYNLLVSEHDLLKKAHDKLKVDFDLQVKKKKQ